MSLAVAASGSTSISTSVVTLNSGSFTTSGVYQLRLNLTPLANGDEFEVKVLTKTVTGGAEAVYGTYRFLHAQGPKTWDHIPIASPYSISFTVQKIAGTDRTIEWLIITL